MEVAVMGVREKSISFSIFNSNSWKFLITIVKTISLILFFYSGNVLGKNNSCKKKKLNQCKKQNCKSIKNKKKKKKCVKRCRKIFCKKEEKNESEESKNNEDNKSTVDLNSPSSQMSTNVCQQDAKMCPDGSSVGRDPGNNCEFKSCPNNSGNVCQQDAKVCPDGSSVGRDPNNNCEFRGCSRGSRLDVFLDLLAPHFGVKTFAEIEEYGNSQSNKQYKGLEISEEINKREVLLSKAAYCSGMDYDLADKEGIIKKLQLAETYYLNPEVLFSTELKKETKDLEKDIKPNQKDIYGTSKNDRIIGNSENNKIRGRDGNDVLKGFDGDDFLNGNVGNDFVAGNKGNDDVRGGQGNDRVQGGQGHDNVVGGRGNDILIGGGGNDRLEGREGNDIYIYRISGGNDTIVEQGEGVDAILCEGIYKSVGQVKSDEDGKKLTISFGSDKHNLIIEDKNLIEYIDCAGLGERDRENLTKGRSDKELDFIKKLTSSNAEAFEDLSLKKWMEKVVRNSKKTVKLLNRCSEEIPNHCNRDVKQACSRNDKQADKKKCEKDLKRSLYKSCYYLRRIEKNKSQKTEVSVLTNSLDVTSCFDDNLDDCKEEVVEDINSEKSNDEILKEGLVDSTDPAINLAKIPGTKEDDQIKGTLSSDTMSGKLGNDVLKGLAGDDVLNGNQGNDTVDGGEGNDTVRGGKGNDTVRGGKGDDLVLGGVGNDKLYGGVGIDVLNGGAGDDVYIFRRGDGFDTIRDTGDGEDKIICQNLDDSQGRAIVDAKKLTIDFLNGDKIFIEDYDQIEKIQCGQIQGLPEKFVAKNLPFQGSEEISGPSDESQMGNDNFVGKAPASVGDDLINDEVDSALNSFLIKEESGVLSPEKDTIEALSEVLDEAENKLYPNSNPDNHISKDNKYYKTTNHIKVKIINKNNKLTVDDAFEEIKDDGYFSY